MRKYQRAAIVVLELMSAQFAEAQQPVTSVERVEITGTRLPALNVEGPSPVTVVGAQEIRMDGLAKTEDLLNNLPQIYAAQGSNISNGATGTAQVNLRNLGPSRTLVLVNGRRLPPGSPNDPAADVNQVPAPLIQRVELLTGGASAVYGSDAIAGVVNFIMNDRFEGLQVDLYHSFYNHQQHQSHIQDIVRQNAARNPTQFQVPSDAGSDGAVNGASMLLGRNFADNRGNATLFIHYKKEGAVTEASRDFSACSLNGGNDFTCGGSSTSFPGRFRLNNGAGPSRTVADAAGNTRPFDAATDLFNFGPSVYFRRASEQFGFNAFAHLDLAPRARVYSEFGFHDNHTEAQIAPSGIFGDSVLVHFENPLLSPDWKAQIAANNGGAPFAASGDTSNVIVLRRNVEGGGRVDDLRHSSYRGVAGLKGEMLGHWNYDVFLQHGKVLFQEAYRNDFSRARVARSLDVVSDPASGQPVCRSVLSGEDPNCVPWNIWRLGGVSRAALDYLQTPGIANGRTQQTVLGASASSDLGDYGIKLPTSRTGVGVVLGVERRTEWLSLDTDVAFSSFDLAGQTGPNIGLPEKSLRSDDIFGELRAPLVEGRRFTDLLSVSGSYRRSDYSSGKKTDTYGMGTEWAPVRNYRLRASYQRAVRHPNILERYAPQGSGVFGLAQDPCGPSDAGGPPTATLAQCARTGITPAQYGSAILLSPGGYTFVGGGNSELDPERASTWTAGIVMAPTSGLTATIDWWSIRIDGAVGAPAPEAILNRCLTTGDLCQLVRRDAAGTLWLPAGGSILATNQNIALLYTTGVDVTANWTRPIGAMGRAGIHFSGVYTNKVQGQNFPGADRVECAGMFAEACGTPNPKWRHKIRSSWASPWNLDLALTWRHIDEVTNAAFSSQPALNNPGAPETSRTIGARDYLDVAASWVLSKTLSLRGGINNIFDRDPPVLGGVPVAFSNGNTFPQMYDALGRLVFLNLTMKF